jgi:hypothetical protein
MRGFVRVHIAEMIVLDIVFDEDLPICRLVKYNTANLMEILVGFRIFIEKGGKVCEEAA